MNAARAANYFVHGWNKVDFLDHDGKTIQPVGFQLRLSMLCVVMRTVDILSCHVIKAWTGMGRWSKSLMPSRMTSKTTS